MNELKNFEKKKSLNQKIKTEIFPKINLNQNENKRKTVIVKNNQNLQNINNRNNDNEDKKYKDKLPKLINLKRPNTENKINVDSDKFKEIQNFTIKNKKSLKSDQNIIKNANSLEEWKRKMRINNLTKVFICYHGYPDLKRALISRGWIENSDQESPYFDLKITLSGKNIDYKNLQKDQIINHFYKNNELTRKVSLSKNLRNLKWFRNLDYETFYPRCYDMTDKNDLDDFIEDFKRTKAESILKRFISQNENEMETNLISLDKVKVAKNIIERILQNIDDVLEDNNYKYSDNCISIDQWNVISEDENHLRYPKLLEKEEETNNKIKKNKKKLKGKDEENDDISLLKDKCIELLSNYEKQNVQYNLNGNKNIWIMKPSGLSRGRGIKCVSSLNQILNYVGGGSNQYVIQKYIENPLILHNRKFDIRQWVLVTDWNPLTVWYYDEPYLRFGAEDYNTKDLSNLYSHLTNNSIAKNSKLFYSGAFEGNMCDSEFFSHLLKEKYGKDIWKTVIQEGIKKLILYTMETVQDCVLNRKNSHEVFGIDIMIDEDFNPWLIEVNSSPCMEYSTKITEKLVKKVMEDTIKVVVDYSSADKSERDNVDTGSWKLLVKAKAIKTQVSPVGLNLIVQGEKANFDELN